MTPGKGGRKELYIHVFLTDFCIATLNIVPVTGSLNNNQQALSFSPIQH